MDVYCNPRSVRYHHAEVERREKTYGEEEIANVVRDVHRQAHVRKVEPIAQPDQGQRNDMVSHEFLEILPRLLKQHNQHQRLLRPITRLQEIIGFEKGVVRAVGECFVHARGVEIPDRGVIHDVKTIRTEDAKVDARVGLFQEAVLL